MKKAGLFLFVLFCYFIGNAQVIRVYFTKSVDNTVSSLADAQTSAHLDDTIVAIIDAAQNNLDMAVWDNGSTKIVTALNNAYNRGVQVRYITSSNALNTALGSLNPNIPVLERNSGITSDVMHNKFILADYNLVLSGSMNFGNGSMFDDYNNIIIIEDATLTMNYLTEFNEMWGSAGATPNTTNSKFGQDKTDNTTHSFTIGGSSVESYFSPTDGTTQKIVDAINSADFTLDVAIFTFTNNDLGDAVIAAKNRGVTVRVILENESYFGSEYNGLVAAGISTISHQSIQYDFHHKYCIIDAAVPSSDPIVVTGSHNWTNSAEQEYDENTLIIHDEVVAGNYQEEFAQRFNELSTAGLAFYLADDLLNLYPAIAQEYIYISIGSGHPEKSAVIYSVDGTQTTEVSFENNEPVYVGHLPCGIYLLKAGNKTMKFIRQ